MPRKKKTDEAIPIEEKEIKTVKKTGKKKEAPKAENPEVIEEAAVTAELSEETQSKPETKQTKQAKYRNIGSYSADIENEFTYSNLSQAEEEEKTFRFMRKCQFDGEILVGTVIGILDDPKRMMVGAKLSYEPTPSKNHYGMVEVTIPENVFFEPGIRFSRDYEQKSLKDRYRIRKTAILQYLGAKIHFCVIGVSREKGYDLENPDQYVTTVIGDRNSAMSKLRDKYFFHRNRKTSEKPITIKPGDLVEAFVVNVTNQMVTVVSLGVETRIYLHDLTRDNVSSCYQYTHVGDILPECQVLSVEAKDDKVQLRLTNNRSKAPKMILSMKKGYYYRGRVVWFNREKDLYTVHLDNGVTAFVFRNNVMSYADLSINDIVSVCITSIFKNKVGGNAVKL